MTRVRVPRRVEEMAKRLANASHADYFLPGVVWPTWRELGKEARHTFRVEAAEAVKAVDEAVRAALGRRGKGRS